MVQCKCLKGCNDIMSVVETVRKCSGNCDSTLILYAEVIRFYVAIIRFKYLQILIQEHDLILEILFFIGSN